MDITKLFEGPFQQMARPIIAAAKVQLYGLLCGPVPDLFRERMLERFPKLDPKSVTDCWQIACATAVDAKPMEELRTFVPPQLTVVK